MLRKSPLAVPTVLLFAACTLKVGDIGELSQGDSADEPSATTAADPLTTGATDILGGETEAPDGTTGDGLTPATGVDILFVIDNSGSMADNQARLATAIPALVDPLTAVGLDLRIAVTTTDAGNPRCPVATSTPEGGNFQTRTCRAAAAEGEWTFNGLDFAASCLARCEHEAITFAPTATAADPQAKPRPWIEWNDGLGNVDVPFADALACLLPQGVAGCGFESPLESMYLALARTQTVGEANFGFIRADADLLIVMISDETDCSYVPAFKQIFSENQVFWNPGDPLPSSAVCWRAGMECTGGPGVYDDCVAVDRDLTGAVTGDTSAAVLQPVTKYTDFLAALQASKTAAGSAAKVHVAAITGVPVGYPEVPLVYQDSADVELQKNFGIGAGCESDGGAIAVPPGRIREVVEQTSPLGPGLFSICDPSFDSSLGALAEGLLED